MKKVRLPAEWESHEATWCSWPHNRETWPSKLRFEMKARFSDFVAFVSEGEKIFLAVEGEVMRQEALDMLTMAYADFSNIEMVEISTNDAWCRDYGADFVFVNDQLSISKFQFNSWGGKYPPFDADNDFGLQVARYLDLPVRESSMVFEGGAIETNGDGLLVTTKNCLELPTRNSSWSIGTIDSELKTFLGVQKVWRIESGLPGDDTDGHIDNIARFVSADTMLIGSNSGRNTALPFLDKNIELLKQLSSDAGRELTLIEVPIPENVEVNGLTIPASYLNFYICNAGVVVPTFGIETDRIALEIIESVFPDREVAAIDSRAITYGQGSFHCLCKQQPAFPVDN